MPAKGTTESPHFSLIDDIAQELSGDVNFPTCMSAAALIRDALRDPEADLLTVAQALSHEPLVASRLMRLANAALYNPGGQPVRDLGNAIGRLGLNIVRTASLSVVLDQMLRTRELADWQPEAHALWERAIHVAAIARVLAQRLGRANPDEAMLSGLVHNLGAFYLLYRACQHPDYASTPERMACLLNTWQIEIGENLLAHLGLPESIVHAVATQRLACTANQPCSVRDILHFAVLLAGDDATLSPEECAERAPFLDLIRDAHEAIEEARHLLDTN